MVIHISAAPEARETLLTRERGRITIKDVMGAVAAVTETPLDALKGGRRDRPTTKVRQIAMYLARELTNKSLYQIGREFNRDYTTVLHGCRQVQEQADSCRATLEKCRNLLIPGYNDVA